MSDPISYVSSFGIALTRAAFIILLLEVCRRTYWYLRANVSSNCSQRYTFLDHLPRVKNFLSLMVAVTLVYQLVDSLKIEPRIGVLSLCLSSALAFITYVSLHMFIVLTPRYKKNYLKKQLNNMGPGLARAFAHAVKKNISLAKQCEQSFQDYIQAQQIGLFSTRGIQSDFMTKQLVIIFFEDLLDYYQDFENCKKNPNLNVHWIPVNSEGICQYDKMKRETEGDEKVLRTGEVMKFEIMMSGSPRVSCSNVFIWTDRRSSVASDADDKHWLIRTFDNKPLENLLEWYKKLKRESGDDKDKLRQADMDLKTQYNLYKECFLKELKSDPECKDKYYILNLEKKKKLSSAILDLEKMIINREHSIGVSNNLA